MAYSTQDHFNDIVQTYEPVVVDSDRLRTILEAKIRKNLWSGFRVIYHEADSRVALLLQVSSGDRSCPCAECERTVADTAWAPMGSQCLNPTAHDKVHPCIIVQDIVPDRDEAMTRAIGALRSLALTLDRPRCLYLQNYRGTVPTECRPRTNAPDEYMWCQNQNDTA